MGRGASVWGEAAGVPWSLPTTDSGTNSVLAGWPTIRRTRAVWPGVRRGAIFRTPPNVADLVAHQPKRADAKAAAHQKQAPERWNSPPLSPPQDGCLGEPQLTSPTAARASDAVQRALQPVDEVLPVGRRGQAGCGGDQLADRLEGPELRPDLFMLGERLTLAWALRSRVA